MLCSIVTLASVNLRYIFLLQYHFDALTVINSEL